jgi:hypothetical protein
MRRNAIIAGLLGLIVLISACSSAKAPANGASGQGALAGRVSSESEGPMEGALISAKAVGGPSA